MIRCRAPAAGYSLLELLFVVALVATLTAISVPQVLAGIDNSRARAATRYVAARLQLARATATSRTVSVGIRFEQMEDGYQFTTYGDGNGNGIRTADIRRGLDAPIDGPERLPARFRGVEFGVLPGLPAVDSSSAAPDGDPIRLGSSSIVTFTPIGSASSGSVYVLGKGGAQYVVRVFGETGRIRVLKFEPGSGRWINQ